MSVFNKNRPTHVLKCTGNMQGEEGKVNQRQTRVGTVNIARGLPKL